MKYLLLTLLLLSSCSSKTEFGKCIGINGDRDPKLNYEMSTRNLVVSVIFFETVFVPIVYALKQTHCPVSRKESK